MNFIVYIVLGILFGSILVALVRNIKVGLIISAIPGIIGFFPLTNYLIQKSSCDASQGCEMGQAGILLFFAYILITISLVSIIFVIVGHKIRAK